MVKLLNNNNDLKPKFYSTQANGFNSYFYKSILNSSIGKFAQRKVGMEIFIDSVEKVLEYKRRNINVIRGIDGSTNMLYMRISKERPKSYSNPLIPALITAEARMYMYEQYKKIGNKDREKHH